MATRVALRNLKPAVSIIFAISLFIAGLQLIPALARAAEVETWQHCMQQTNPALSSTACTSIIDANKESSGNLAYAYLYRARAAAYCFRKDQAAKDYHEALQRDPSLGHAWYGLGQQAMAAQDFASAEQNFAKAIDSHGEDADFDRYASDSPGSFAWEPLRARGFARYKKSDLALASADYAAAIKACPTCATPYRNRGILNAVQHKLDDAFADFNRAIALNPRALQGFFARGFILTRMEQYDKAVPNFTEAIRLNPNSQSSYRARADAYAKLGKTKEADEDRKHADAVAADLQAKRRSSCGRAGPDAGPGEDDDAVDDDDSNPPVDATAIKDNELTKLIAGKKWQAKQGIWSDELEFRRDGSFRQRANDDTQNGKLQVTTDGAWTVSQNKLCLFTNSQVCVAAHETNGTLNLTRVDGTLEYTGSEAKLQTISLDNATAPIKEYPLDEQFHAAPAGSAKGPKTLFYYIHGLPLSPRMHNPLETYFVTQIRASQGWDVIEADFPFKLETQYMYRGDASTFAAAAHVARRIKELKTKGYQRIFVGGQLMGGWAALALSTQPKLPLDGVLMISPICCSGRTAEDTGAPSSDFINNKLFYEPLIKRDLYPTAAVFFPDPEIDPGGRGEVTSKALNDNKIANLVIDNPEGFTGTGAMWLPVFDYSYRECIVAFLVAPKTTSCSPPKLSDSDFRTVFRADQIPDLASRKVDPATLIGREFAAYPSARTYKLASADSTVLKSQEAGERTVPSSFKNGQYCVSQSVRFARPIASDEECFGIVRWSDRELLLLNPQGNQVMQWWVADNTLASINASSSFTSTDGKFAVSFPGTPALQKTTGATNKGTPFDQSRWSIETKAGWFAVSMITYAKPVTDKNYDSNVSGVVAATKGNLVSQKPVDQNGIQAREVLIDVPNAGQIRQRFVWIGDRFYQVVFSGKTGSATASEVDAFLTSFRGVN